MCPRLPQLNLLLIIALFFISYLQCDAQDPWDYVEKGSTKNVDDDRNIPPDLRFTPKKRKSQTDESYGIGEWFYRRILGIVLKGGQIKENEDGSVDISLQMKLDQKIWNTLQGYLVSTSSLTEDKFRRSLGYIEQSIYEPSLPTKIILAWSDYIQMYLSDYKTEITWSLALIAMSMLLFWSWKHISRRTAVIIVIIGLYTYEVFVSFKEAEQKEIEKFVAAVNSCKWYVWSTQCELPKPDPLIFLKHMNPLKIGIRMFTSIISEPIIVLSDTVKILTHGITDGLWYPFDIIMYGIFITFFNIVLLIFLITIVFNFVLNIPINLSFGLFSVVLRQRRRSLFSDSNDSSNDNQSNTIRDNSTAISGASLDKLLDIISRSLSVSNTSNLTQPALQGSESPRARKQITNTNKNVGLRRSASTGRLPYLKSFDTYDQRSNALTKRNVGFKGDGSGDAQYQY